MLYSVSIRNLSCMTRSMDLVPDGPGGPIIIDLIDVMPEPVAYFRVRGTDIAGNQGEWSSLFRSDHSTMSSTLDIETDPAIASGSPLEVRVRSDIGILPGSVELIIEDETGAVSILGPKDTDILLNSTPIEGSDMKVPSLVKAVFEIPYDEGTLEVRVKAEDPFPMSRKWESGGLSVVIDNSPPVIEINARTFYTSREIQIPIMIMDDDSGLGSFEVSRNEGPFDLMNSPGASSLYKNGDGGHVIGINLSWGEPVEFTVRVTDLAGLSSTASFSTRATRAPTISISQSVESPIIYGSPITLTARGVDEDGDELEYSWYLDGELYGSGSQIDPLLEVGVHNIKVNCTDGDLFSESQVQVLVEEVEDEKNNEKSSFSGVIIVISIILVLIIAGAVAAFLFWKKRGEDDDTFLDWDDDEEDEDENHIIKSGSSRKGEDGTQCSICLRPLRNSSNMMKCRCGARFHRGCAVKEGECPDCGRELMLRKDL